MGKIKIRNHTFNIADITRLVHFATHETLLYLGPPLEDNTMTICVGIGIVKKIQKGQDFDLVNMSFGRGYSRAIIVKSNHARRQIYTLKRGQYAWFYGLLKTYKENGKRHNIFYAKAFQGWFVPKNMDIIKIDPNEIEKLEEENESQLNFIDKLLEGNDDGI